MSIGAIQCDSRCVSWPIGLLASPSPAAVRSVEQAQVFRSEAEAWIGGVLDRMEVVPGLALSVVVGDSVVLAEGYGLADVENVVPATGETVYYIASATKPFTALMALVLESNDVVDLNSTLAGHLPGVTMADSLRPEEVRLRDLLTHTSGIANGPITGRLAFTGEHDPETLWRLLDHSTGAEGLPWAASGTPTPATTS